MRFARYRLGKQCLAGTGGADQKRALRELCTDGRILLRVVQKIDDLYQGFFCFILSGNIAEGNAGFFFHIDLGFALSDGADTAEAALSAHTFSKETHEKHQPEEEQQRENDPVQDKRYRTVIG